MSGSPIIGHYQEKGKEIMAFIGIHARGANFEKYNNLGLLFTPKIIDKMNEYINKNSLFRCPSWPTLPPANIEDRDQSAISSSSVSSGPITE